MIARIEELGLQLLDVRLVAELPGEMTAAVTATPTAPGDR